MSEKTYVPLHVHSYFSLLDGLSSPKEIVNRCCELGLPACAISDHGAIFGIKTFYDECKKKNIKPILGTEAYICEQDATIKSNANNKRHHLIILAKNDQGIKDLMALVSESNKPEHFYRKPRIHLDGIRPFAAGGNLIALSACIGGQLPSSLFVDFRRATGLGGHGENLDVVREELRPDWLDVGKTIIDQHIDVFGKDNFYIELQDEGMSSQTVVVECLRKLGKKYGIKTVATIDAHYARQSDAEDQRLLLCAQLHTTKEDQARRQQAGGDVMDFFVSDKYYIPSYKEMRECFTEAELATTLEIADQIEYSHLGRKPCLPIFTNDESKKLGMDSMSYLKSLCIEGATAKLSHLSADKKKQYWARLQKEWAVIQEAQLADYLLIVRDACNFIDRNHGPRGKGRGSGAGSLVNYLVDITGIDPIEYGLYFERFYNCGRNVPECVSFDELSFSSFAEQGG